jgi:diguanylate cyclase (GGDEF)-like protein
MARKEAVQMQEPTSLLKNFEGMEFDWNLEKDTMQWKSLASDLPLQTPLVISSGNFYNNYLSPHDFWERMRAIAHVRRDDNTYSCEYTLKFPGYDSYEVIEEGSIIFDNQNKPKQIKGSLKNKDNVIKEASNLSPSGYDDVTHLPDPELLFENLSSFMEQARVSGLPGAFLVISVEKLGYLNCRYGDEITKEILKKAASIIKKTIRFDDYIGHINGGSIGLIAKDCDEWGLMSFAGRLLKHIENLSISQDDSIIQPHLLLGGVIFPEDFKDILSVVEKAFQTQLTLETIKEKMDHTLQKYPRPQISKPYKRRMTDEDN